MNAWLGRLAASSKTGVRILGVGPFADLIRAELSSVVEGALRSLAGSKEWEVNTTPQHKSVSLASRTAWASFGGWPPVSPPPRSASFTDLADWLAATKPADGVDWLWFSDPSQAKGNPQRVVAALQAGVDRVLAKLKEMIEDDDRVQISFAPDESHVSVTIPGAARFEFFLVAAAPGATQPPTAGSGSS